MKKYLLLIFCILAIFIATTNTEPIQNTLNNIKILIQGEENQKPIVSIIDNTTNNNTNNNTNNSSNNKINNNNNTNNTSFSSNTNINSSNKTKTQNNTKIYNKDGIYFQYPSYWSYDEIKKLLSFYNVEYLSRWDDGMIFYIENKAIEEELAIQQNSERYKDPKNITVDGKKAYSLIDTKGDYWHYLILVEKNKEQNYIITFYCDQELKKQNKILFDEILSTMRLN